MDHSLGIEEQLLHVLLTQTLQLYNSSYTLACVDMVQARGSVEH